MSGYKMLSEQDLETEHPSYCLTFCDEECIQHSLSNEYAFSMVFTILTLLISGYHIRKHLQNFNNPFFQSKIIIIMIMAPFYCVTSMGSFIWPVPFPSHSLSSPTSPSPGTSMKPSSSSPSSTSSFPIWPTTASKTRWRIRRSTSS